MVAQSTSRQATLNKRSADPHRLTLRDPPLTDAGRRSPRPSDSQPPSEDDADSADDYEPSPKKRALRSGDSHPTEPRSPLPEGADRGARGGGGGNSAGGLFRQMWSIHYARHTFTCLTTGLVVRHAKNASRQVMVATADGRLVVLTSYGHHSTTVDTNHEYICSLKAMSVTRLATVMGAPVRRTATEAFTPGDLDDVIVGDSQGAVSVYTNLQLLSREQVGSSPIQCLAALPVSPQYQEIIAGDAEGSLLNCVPHQVHWRIRLGDRVRDLLENSEWAATGRPGPAGNAASSSAVLPLTSEPGAVQALLAVQFGSTSTGEATTHTIGTIPYLLVSLQLPYLAVLSRHGHLVRLIPLPAQLTAMAQGHFVTTGDAPRPPPNDREGGSAMDTNEGLIPPEHDDGGGGRNQVLLGCADGSVLLLLGADWSPRHLFTCDYAITRLVPFRVPVETRPAAVTNAASTASSVPITESGSASVATPTVTTATGPVLDWVVCAGHSNRVFVYEGSHCRTTLELTDWPLDLTVDDIDLDGRPEIIVLDGESIVKAFRLS